MIIKTISATYERKFNLGDYNSMTVGATAWADLEEEDAEREAFAQLFASLKETVKEQAMPVLSKQTAKVSEVFAGLPKSVTEGHDGDQGTD